MATLIEQYKNRIAKANEFYKSNHNGQEMSLTKQLITARCLDNTSKFLNEAFANSKGTQLGAMQDYKRFCAAVTSVAVPDLIAHELCMTYPMASITGYVAYLKFTAGSNKGETKQGDVFNDAFRLGKVDPNYTSDRVVETSTVAAEGTKTVTLLWTPVEVVDGKLKDGKILTAAGVEITDYTATAEGVITINAGANNGDTVKVGYLYNNAVIPQNDLPILNAEMDGIDLKARVRRIAVYYSNLAAFQAKNDYDFDMQSELAKQAVGQLNYEIDTECVKLLADNAEANPALVWSSNQPYGVSMTEHYQSFLKVIGDADNIIYTKTRRFKADYIVIAADVLPVINFIHTYVPAPARSVNGPYFAGTIGALKVFVSPALESSTFFFGVNRNELKASAAVFAPYMPIVPTQLLGYADGGMSQGFSTMYDLKILNKDLLVSGRITA